MSYARQVIHMHTCDFCGAGEQGQKVPTGWSRMWAPTAADMANDAGHRPEPLDACIRCTRALLKALGSVATCPSAAYAEALEHVSWCDEEQHREYSSQKTYERMMAQHAESEEKGPCMPQLGDKS